MDVNITVAITAALSAILSSLLTALITRRGNHKLKTTELLFNARAEAYRDLIKTTANFPSSPTAEDTVIFDSISASAILFSSKRTQTKIANYCSLVLENDNSPDGINAFAKARRDAVWAMQQDLQKHRI